VTRPCWKLPIRCCAAAATLGVANDLPVDSVRIGHIDGDLFDPHVAWAQFRGINTRGAVVVRPHRVVGWRSTGAAADAAATLAEALGTILGTAAQIKQFPARRLL
jgi:2,4-dichlorophenol 6-monooxygenase